MEKVNESVLELLKNDQETMEEVGLARTQYSIISKVVQETKDRLAAQEKELAELEAQLAELQK